jgi:cytochrome P450/NADPH-cytochrome P450 reductase
LQNVATLADAADDADTKTALTELSGALYTDEISAKRVSVLELLERYPSVSLPLASFLSMMPPMRVRQ